MLIDPALQAALPTIMLAAFVSSASPGPATLAIARASMTGGLGRGIAMALGVSTGSWIWSAAAAMGLSAVLAAAPTLAFAMRVLAAGYLAWLALRSARSAWRGDAGHPQAAAPGGAIHNAYLGGLALHIFNPKPVLFFGALYAIGVPGQERPESVLIIFAVLALQSLAVFCLVAALFAQPGVIAAYARLQRWFEALFALVFGSAAAFLMRDALAKNSG